MRMRPVAVFLEPSPTRERELQERLAAILPGWFGKPDSNSQYASQASRNSRRVGRRKCGVRHGLLLLKQSSPASAEVYWRAQLTLYHHPAKMANAFELGPGDRQNKTRVTFVGEGVTRAGTARRLEGRSLDDAAPLSPIRIGSIFTIGIATRGSPQSPGCRCWRGP